jgi:hypothetical protein
MNFVNLRLAFFGLSPWICFARRFKVVPASRPIDGGQLGRSERANLREAGFRKSGGPLFLQERGFFGRDSNQQFIVLAVGESAVDVSAFAAGDGLAIDFKSASAGSGEAGQVGSESIADIHHGRRMDIFCEPPTLLKAGNEIQMVSCDRTSKLSGNEEQIARFSA